ncbi:cysteine hydrolase [bacterium]|nr:cysteine hydrolase [bacterium]
MNENGFYVNESNLAEACERWLSAIEPFNQHKMDIAVENAALLVVDMQKFFLDPASPTFTCGGRAVTPGIARLIDSFRTAGRPVIYTCHVHHPDGIDAGIMADWWEGMCIEGSPESEVADELAPLPGEKIIFKHRYSAFYNTDLDTVLRCLGVRDIVVCGIMTNLCCESTVRDAYFRDYRVFFPADGTGSINEEMHMASLLNLSFGFAFVTRVEDIIAQM